MIQSLRWLPLLVALSTVSLAGPPQLQLQPGDHLCLVGNALGERMQHHNYWETLLHSRFPQHQLVVRNLCFPGDEPQQRLRSLNFGTPDQHLTHSKASVVLLFFGFNESFAGRQGLDRFTRDVTQLVHHMRQQDYSGKGAPRIVLISPIAAEKTVNPHLPDGQQRSALLALYTQALSAVAQATSVGFVDLFTPTQQLFEASSQQLTLNGVHLNDQGYAALAPILDRGLFGAAGAPSGIDPQLRAAIQDKNFHWWHRYRAVNGYSIYGTRGQAGFDGTYRNTDVMERERAILDQMTANRDQRIWRTAQGKSIAATVDDDNTLPFLQPKTNVGGPDDPNRQRGKLGSLEYIPAAEQQKLFRLAPGYEINLVASEEQFPELANPVALNFDNRGRLWVATMPSYPQWQPKTKLDDKLLILEDQDGDGRADQCQVFAGGLHQPTGFEIGRDGVYVAQQPDILYLQDTDGDDRADRQVRQLIGFDTADSHHGLAAFEWGPGGALYFQEGTFKQSQVESPYGVQRLSDAGVWRYDPTDQRLDVHVSLAMANPWGHVFDRWGQNFIADASPGHNFWAAPISGRVQYPDKHAGGARAKNLDWGGSRSDASYPTFIEKRIRPSSGCEIVSSRHFPPEAQGNFLLNNVIGDLGVLQHTIREEGSGFVGEEITPLVLSEHGNFRPVDLQFGPDGALYIVDWHNALIGHLQHNLRDPSRDHSHGRIWRITYPSRPLLQPPQIDGAPIADLLDLLKQPEDRTRYRARRELAQRGADQVTAELSAWLGDLDPSDPEFEHHRLEALWVCQTHHVVNEDLLRQVLQSPDHRARAAAVRVASYWHASLDDPLQWLRPAIDDPHPRVRLEAVRACSFIDSPAAISAALDALNHPMDDYLSYTLDETIRALEDALGRATPLLAESGQHAHDHTHAAHGQPPGEHAHAAGDAAQPTAAAAQPTQPPPLVFLDKSTQAIQYQLARLPAAQLLRIERSADDPRSRPVYQAILSRPGVSREDRQQAAASLAKLSGTDVVAEVLRAVEPLRWSEPDERSVVQQLAALLMQQPPGTLARHGQRFEQATTAASQAARAVGFAALIAADDSERAWSLASPSADGRHDFLVSLSLLPRADDRVPLRPYVMQCLELSEPLQVQQAAIQALAGIPAEQHDTFQRLAAAVSSAKLRAAAVDTLLAIPATARTPDGARRIVDHLVLLAEQTPPARRTTADFLKAMQLADQLLSSLPLAEARGFRNRLREVVVRVVRIGTVHEEMRYDVPYFAVEAGRPVQLVLHNDDLMPHNLVLTMPGTMRDVALQAAAMTPDVDSQGRQYVPDSANVLQATRMVQPHQQQVLTFQAPTEPGEYPYVCTFPNHWMRMNGVMVVVEDLDAWLADPVVPADPMGSNRSFVQSWSMDDFEDGDLSAALQGRQLDIGRRLFEEASCLQCHQVQGQGGRVGPDLAGVVERLKGDHRAVLRELIDPSHKIDPQYAVHNILTLDGQLIAGIVTGRDAETVTVVSNPENPQPQTVRRDDIEQMMPSPTSMMPKGLLDRFTRDEIYELLNYVLVNSSHSHGH